MIVAQSEAQLDALVAALGESDRIGVDVEGNGLHAYRAELCVVQFSWKKPDGAVEIAIVDPFSVDVDPLANILGEKGPIKVLHDLTFDARLLSESGIRLGRVHDTSVCAQLLGEPKSGLASLVESHFGVAMSKGLQDHDWAARPFTDKQLSYLAEDVRYLIDLDDALVARVREADIAAEVVSECDYKLGTAFDPPRDQRPPHERIKGYAALPGVTRSVLRELCTERERIAEQQDVPPFRIIANGLLLAMAQRMPREERVVQQMCRNKTSRRYADAWLAAIARGRDAGPLALPPVADSPNVPPGEQARQKALKRKLSEWRKKEATQRSVALQAVIPGHAMDAVSSAIVKHHGDADGLLEELSAIAGLGDARIDRYLGTWLELGCGAR